MKESPVQTFSEIPLAQTVVGFCALKKIQHIVISPGSRNAPLTQGFTQNSFFKTYSIVDERSAAFFALGLAQQLKQPTALVCTSGSALLNYYPAVSEAFYSDIPLVVISADRMPHRIDVGDGQTIRQPEVFEPHLVAAAYLKPDVIHATEALRTNPSQKLIAADATPTMLLEEQERIQLSNEEQLNSVLNMVYTQSGPVHLNVPLEEPLYGTTSSEIVLQKVTTSNLPDPISIGKPMVDLWNNATKKIILIGVLAPHSILEETLNAWASDPSVIVMTEKTSNIKHPRFIDAIDSLIAPLENGFDDLLQSLQPDLLVSLGGMVVSKKIKNFLRKFPPKQHWHIHPKKAYDTYYVLSDHIKTEPQVFFDELLSKASSSNQSTYNNQVSSIYNSNRLKGLHYLKQIPFSDLKVFQTIFKSIPDQLQLQLANSSTIRYAQLFDLPKTVSVFCNRGTSGIDGSSSTAVGAAFVSQVPTLLITGDLSFFYDSNAFWNAYLKKNFRIIIINNQGGGIFRILPGQKDTPTYDQYYETVHKRNAKDLCKSLGVGYSSVSSEWRLKRKLKSFFNPSNHPQVLEIFTPRKSNDQILLNYFRAMQ
ncbi:MAG: thiamine pyrophosphate-binding protein [Flavobacteriaceae bacterium]|nr:thiamine pyrophosphate-binding protein [Flavobacteriaceae bacterium]